jgi:hypothetical protein
MAGRKKKFKFITTLAPIDGVFMKTAIFLPQDVIRQLPKGRVRAKGIFNGAPFSLAVQHVQDGGWYFSVSAPLRKAAGIKIGDKVEVAFELVDPDLLDIPEELEALLQQDENALKAWQKLTTGYQRSLIHYITSVKNVDSRIKRSLLLMEKAKAGLLQGQQKK